MIKTNQEIIDLYKGLQSVEHLTGAKFAYAVARNSNLLKKELIALRQANVPTDDYMEYEEARGALAESHSKKDKDGKPETFDNGNRFVIEDPSKFEEAFKELRLKHKAVISVRKKQEKEFNELLEEKVEIELFMIPQSYLPEDISTKQMVAILPIVKEKE